MKKERVKNLVYKKESERSKTEKIVRDVVFYGLVIYAAVLGYLLVDANIALANAQVDYANNCVQMTHAVK